MKLGEIAVWDRNTVWDRNKHIATTKYSSHSRCVCFYTQLCPRSDHNVCQRIALMKGFIVVLVGLLIEGFKSPQITLFTGSINAF